MAGIVNLNRARKARDRAAAKAQAAANRVAFGRTGAQKRADLVDRARADQALDGARLSDAAPPRDRR